MVKHIIIGFWKKNSNANATTQVVDFPATRRGLMTYVNSHRTEGLEGYILNTNGKIIARYSWSDTKGTKIWKDIRYE